MGVILEWVRVISLSLSLSPHNYLSQKWTTRPFLDEDSWKRPECIDEQHVHLKPPTHEGKEVGVFIYFHRGGCHFHVWKWNALRRMLPSSKSWSIVSKKLWSVISLSYLLFLMASIFRFLSTSFIVSLYLERRKKMYFSRERKISSVKLFMFGFLRPYHRNSSEFGEIWLIRSSIWKTRTVVAGRWKLQR